MPQATQAPPTQAEQALPPDSAAVPASDDGASQEPHLDSPAPVHHRVTAVAGLALAGLILILSVSAFVFGKSGEVNGSEVGTSAAEFSLRDRTADRVSLGELLTDRPVLLIFCGETGEGIEPTVLAPALQNAPELQVVAVRQGTDACEPLAALAGAMQKPIIDLDDSQQNVSTRYGIRLTPTKPTVAVLVRQDGQIIRRGDLLEVVTDLPGQLSASLQ